jgi:hypothetical protein
VKINIVPRIYRKSWTGILLVANGQTVMVKTWLLYMPMTVDWRFLLWEMMALSITGGRSGLAGHGTESGSRLAANGRRPVILLLWSMPMAGLRFLWLATTRSFTTGGRSGLEANGIKTGFVENLYDLKDMGVDLYVENMEKVSKEIRRDKGLPCLCRC